MSVSFGAAHRHQLMPDRQEPFADDEQAGSRQQMMDVGDAAGDRILDRDHAEIGLARGDRGQRVLEGRAGQRLGVGIGLDDGDMGIGARLALECDFELLGHGGPFSSRSGFGQYLRGRFRGRPGYRRRAGRVSTMVMSIRMPASSARSCSSFSCCSSGDGRQRHEPLQRGAAIGIEADVVVARPVAIGRRGAGEIERAQPAARRSASRPPSPRSGLGASSSVWICGGQRRDVDGGVVERRQHGADVVRRDGGKVALQIDHDLGLGRRDRASACAS